MENLCEVCGQPMRHIPAGVSKKTGRPYNAFWVCDNKCPKPSKKNPIQVTPKVDMDQVKQYNAGKEDNMKELNAKKGAYDFTNLLLELKQITPEEWQAAFEKKANQIYNFRCTPFD